MWAAALLRFIRKRVVLGIIFLFSLTYCIVSFMKEGSSTTSYEIDTLPIRPLDRSFLWHSSKDDTNSTDVKVSVCRNSVQGKVLIVDDRGYICSRGNILPSGCCNTEAENTKRYSCDTCKESGCCSIYEYCISCCLHPDKVLLINTDVAGKHIGTLKIAVAILGVPGLGLRR